MSPSPESTRTDGGAAALLGLWSLMMVLAAYVVAVGT